MPLLGRGGQRRSARGRRRSPEVAVGAALGRGQSLEVAAAAVKQRVEAIELIPKIAAWASRRSVPTPIFHAMAEGVLKGRPSEEIIRQLMTTPIEEFV